MLFITQIRIDQFVHKSNKIASSHLLKLNQTIARAFSHPSRTTPLFFRKTYILRDVLACEKYVVKQVANRDDVGYQRRPSYHSGIVKGNDGAIRFSDSFDERISEL